jgi:hypothetical protein
LIIAEEARALTVPDFLRDAEIGYFDATLVVHENVTALDVSMDDVPLVQIIEALENLTNEILNERFFESSVVA